MPGGAAITYKHIDSSSPDRHSHEFSDGDPDTVVTLTHEHFDGDTPHDHPNFVTFASTSHTGSKREPDPE